MIAPINSPMYFITRLNGKRPGGMGEVRMRCGTFTSDLVMVPVLGTDGTGDQCVIINIACGFTANSALMRQFNIDEIRMIEYAIIAFDGNNVIRQDYHHDFKPKTPARISHGVLHAAYVTESLGFLLKTERVAKSAKGIQFVS